MTMQCSPLGRRKADVSCVILLHDYDKPSAGIKNTFRQFLKKGFLETTNYKSIKYVIKIYTV